MYSYQHLGSTFSNQNVYVLREFNGTDPAGAQLSVAVLVRAYCSSLVGPVHAGGCTPWAVTPA